MNSEIIVNVTRGSLKESIHKGHIAVVDSNGNKLAFLGNHAYKTFARSTAKTLQTIPVIETGAAEKYHLTDEEIAVLCASHNGESSHVSTVESVLSKIGLNAQFIQCGTHEPYDQELAETMKQRNEIPTCLHNNCSGKHAGMLALAQHLKCDLETYMSIDHPVQEIMLNTICEMSDLDVEHVELGIDGCGVPVYALPIDRLALAYARLANPEQLKPDRVKACNRIISGIQKYPYLLAGKNRFDTLLIKLTKGRIIGKIGAEAIFALSIPTKGWGIVIKVEDGSNRALYPAVIETLKQLGLLSKQELMDLDRFHNPRLLNWNQKNVGFIQPDFVLKR